MTTRSATAIPTQMTAIGSWPFMTLSDEHLYTCLRAGTCGVGVLVRSFDRGPGVGRDWRISLFPAIRIPRVGDARASFTAFCFQQDDERFIDLGLDEDDGEITLHEHVDEFDEVEGEIERMLAFLAQAAPIIRDYVAEHIKLARQKAR